MWTPPLVWPQGASEGATRSLDGRERLAAVVGAFTAHGRAELAVFVVIPLAFASTDLPGADAGLDLRPQHVDVLAAPPDRETRRGRADLGAVEAPRIQPRMSICSATQASAQEVQNSEQSIAGRAAVTSCSFTSPPTTGCRPTIFESDIGPLVVLPGSRRGNPRAGRAVAGPNRCSAPLAPLIGGFQATTVVGRRWDAGLISW